jgi:hypothetical protein
MLPTRRYFFTLMLLSAFGLLLCWVIREAELAAVGVNHNITYHLFANLEPLVLSVTAVIFLSVFLGYRRWVEHPSSGGSAVVVPGVWFLWLILAVFAVTVGGRYLIFMDYPLSMDEFAMEFQSEIFLRGDLAAPLPEWARGWVYYFLPTWIHYHYLPHEWLSMYGPLFSLMLAPWEGMGLAGLFPPILAMGTLFFLKNIMGDFCPQRPLAAWTAVVLLAFSPQFLVTAMTPYAMSGHLFISTLWLWLYLQDRTWSWFLLPWLGFIAIGLHQPVPHALFVLPFCLRILQTQPWHRTLYVGAVYSGACLFWYFWMQQVQYTDDPLAQPVWAEYFVLPGWHQIMGRLMNMVYLMSWQHLLLLYGFLIALTQWRRFSSFEKDLVFSVLATFGFFFFFYEIGGHGWGSRHCHIVLSNFAIVSGLAITRLLEEGKKWNIRFFVVITLIGFMVIFPIRLWQIHSFVAPYHDADDYISQLDADFVIIPSKRFYYGVDLIRNDPYLREKPIRIGREFLSKEKEARLAGMGTIVELTSEELAPFGIAPVEVTDEFYDKLCDFFSRQSDEKFDHAIESTGPSVH